MALDECLAEKILDNQPEILSKAATFISLLSQRSGLDRQTKVRPIFQRLVGQMDKNDNETLLGLDFT